MTDFSLNPSVIQIPLTRGYAALVSIEDKDLAEIKWNHHPIKNRNKHYADRYNSNEKPHTVWMHRIIVSRMLERDLESHEYVDHVDGNGLNNTRSNLRLADSSQNGSNRGKPCNNTSGYKGVTWYKKYEKWRASIKFQKRDIFLGSFDTKEDAARAYNEAALKYHGEFARLNEI